MKLDRNIEGNDGRGKYALLHLRKLAEIEAGSYGPQTGIRNAIRTLENSGLIQWGDTREDEFFVIKLKDKYAQVALRVYADAARPDDQEYASEIWSLADGSGPNHPLCKKPD